MKSFQFLLAGAVFLISGLPLSQAAAEPVAEIKTEQESSSAPSGMAPLRVRSYHELMTPGFAPKLSSVPQPDGSPLTPYNLFGWVAVDYEVSPGYRLLYHQRHLIDLADANTGAPAFNANLLDSRFGLRRIGIFDVKNLDSVVDIYFQLPVSAGSITDKKIIDLGFRANMTYTVPQSRWSFGTMADAFYSIRSPDGKGADLTGFVNPWVSYNLTSTLSTQTWVLIPFQHESKTSWEGFNWDFPTMAPVIQNGIGWDVNDHVWVALMVNNHLLAPPTLENTWVSFWLSMKTS